MNQEKFRRLARWRLPSGVYNPVVTADGRRWRDYERAAELRLRRRSRLPSADSRSTG